jgi:hypothetical protein
MFAATCGAVAIAGLLLAASRPTLSNIKPFPITETA